MNRITIENAWKHQPILSARTRRRVHHNRDRHLCRLHNAIAQPANTERSRNPVANTTPLQRLAALSRALRRHHRGQRDGRRHPGVCAQGRRDHGAAHRAWRICAAGSAELGRRGGLRAGPLQKRRSIGTTTDGRPFSPGTYYYVGGNTKFYGSSLVRFRREDFQSSTHHDGESPAWPFGYDDLAPHYPPRRSTSTRCMATPMTRRCPQRTLPVPRRSATNHRCRRWPTGCASWATPRRRSRSGIDLRQGGIASVAPPATASLAERWPSRMPTCPAYAPPSPAAPSSSSPTPHVDGCSPTTPADAPPASNV